jgi:DNA-binding transcriptional MerR regulator
MGQYSIKELEILSGIKAHTLRIWEKRYAIITPKRTSTNIRFYSDDDLKKIINVSLLNNRGLKISKLVQLSEEELAQKVLELSEQKHDNEIHIDQLITAMIDMEEEAFNAVLEGISQKMGFEAAVLEVLYPFLNKIGILWHAGNVSPAQEHFITHLIRQKMIVAIDALQIPPKRKKKAMLFLPENELHEIGLLFYHYVIRKMGVRTYYLGQTVPYRDVKLIGKIHKPDFILTSITSFPVASELPEYISTLCKDFNSSKILLTGSALAKTKVGKAKNLFLFRDAKELKHHLEAQSA